MENFHFLDQENIEIKKDRPTFLAVLTIFTFIFSGFFLVYSLYGAVTYNKIEAVKQLDSTISELETQSAELNSLFFDNVMEGVISFTEEEMENPYLYNWLAVLSYLMSLIGAFLMYQMKKAGFHVYVLSKLIGFIPLIVFSFNLFVGLYFGFFLLFTLAFILMYAVNLKHFNK